MTPGRAGSAHGVTPLPPHSWQKLVLGSDAALAFLGSAVAPSPADARNAIVCLLPMSCTPRGSGVD